MKQEKSFAHPRYWVTWVVVFFMKLLGQFGHKVQLKIGRSIGFFAHKIAKRRRHVTEVNLKHCFPEKTDDEREQMVRQCLNDNAIGVMETMRAWWGPRDSMDGRIIVEGEEHIRAAVAEGRGVLLVGAHYTTLDLGALMIKEVAPIVLTYKANGNLLLDAMIRKGRLNNVDKVIERSDMRGFIKALKSGEILWYAPDQDYGPAHSVFAPFFGVSAASVKMTRRLASINNSPVVIVSHHRSDDDQHYYLRFRPALDDYPSGDELADAARINKALENEIRLSPTQYMWVHRRFKSRPEGEKGLY